MLKKMLSCFLIFVVCFSLCSCNTVNTSTDELLSPPKPTGEYQNIQKALENAVKGTVKLKYPTSGEHRSAFIPFNLYGNKNKNYCIALYALGDEKSQNIHINLINKQEKEWLSLYDTHFEASNVEKIDFIDLTGDGKREIVIGFNVFSGVDKQVMVLSLNKTQLKTRLLEPYDNFLFSDLNADKLKELFVVNLDAANTSSTAKLFTFDKNGVKEESCKLDGTVSSYENPVVTTLANDQPAIFIDAVKGKGMITEAITLKDGKLFAPFIDETSGQNIITQRDMSIAASDINGDNRLDIPTLKQISGVTGNDVSSSYVTSWINYNGKEVFVMEHTIMNYVDGYYLIIPEEYITKIGINRQTDSRQRTFYLWDYKKNVPKKELFTIMVVTLDDQNKLNAKDGYFELARDKTYVYLGKIGAKKNGVSKKRLKAMFNLIEF